jgi:hypothetical protein
MGAVLADATTQAGAEDCARAIAGMKIKIH